MGTLRMLRGMGTGLALLASIVVFSGCYETGSGPSGEASVEGTWIQTRVEFSKQTAKGRVPLPVISTVVNGDTLRTHVYLLDTAIGAFFDPWRQALLRIEGSKVVRQGAFGLWLLDAGWNPGEGFPMRDSTTFVKLAGSRRLVNGSDTVLCARSGAELKIEFHAMGLSDSIVMTAYYKPYAGAFPAPDFPYGSEGIHGLDSLAGQMQTDTALQDLVNQKLLDLQNGLTDLQHLLDSLQAPSDSSLGVDPSVGGPVAFYQFGDKLDNDGDGCIDEEIVDSLDNDLDGFIDEDARLINPDHVDNDHNGSQDEQDAGENKLGGTTASRDLLAFVALSGQGSNWVKIKKEDPGMDLRIKIQGDSLALPSRKLLPGYAQKLDSAKTLVGGCWRNY